MNTYCPPYSPKLSGIAEQASKMLEDDGVNTQDILQRIVDDGDFRARIVRLWFSPEPVSGFDWDSLNLSRVKNYIESFFHLDPQILPELTTLQKFRLLAHGLTNRDLDIFCARAGIYKVDFGKSRTSIEDLATRHGISRNGVKNIAERTAIHIHDRVLLVMQGEIR